MMQQRIPQLRDATAADRDLCFEIKKKAFGNYVDEIWGWEEGVQRRLHDKDFVPDQCRIVTLNSQNVGLLVISTEGNSLWINQIYILPIHQNRGYGTRIIQGVIGEADQVGKTVKLQVLKINPAKKLYERLGFTVTGTNGPHHVMERALVQSVRTSSERNG
jgi:GNAT superfamily N-acetyltransferase